MKSYLTFALGMRRHGLLDIGLSDWSHHTLDQIVDRSLVATACFYEMLNLMSRIAEQIMPEDLAFLTKLQTETKQAFLENFRNSDGTYAKDELTANACALYFHFEDSPELAAHLRDTVQQGSYHADFGILGAKIVPRVLAEHNYAADAFRLYTQTEYPGWGNWILRGATTLWERWNGNDSQTHIMFGDFPAWCFRYLAGIKILEPGFKKISLSPADIPEAGDFLFSYRTPAGCIEVGRSESGFFKKVPSGIEISAT